MPVAGAGDVTVIVPVATAHVGCVKVTAGAAGVTGEAAIVAVVTTEVHPAPLVVVTAYAPGVNPAKIPVPLVTGATTGAVPATV